MSDGYSHVYTRLNGVPTPPGSVYGDLSDLDALSTGSASPPHTASPASQLARLRSLKIARHAKREEDQRELRRATSLTVRARPLDGRSSPLCDSPTSSSPPASMMHHPVSVSIAGPHDHNHLRMPPSPTSPTSPQHRTRHPALALRPKVGDALEPMQGSRFVLQRVLGRGAFSSVWLARDESVDAACHPDVYSSSGRRRSECTAPKRGERVHGLRPPTRDASLFLRAPDSAASTDTSSTTPLVAVKVMDRAACDANDRTRIAFVREVEVLRVCSVFVLHCPADPLRGTHVRLNNSTSIIPT